jgi:hypothetical protein
MDVGLTCFCRSFEATLLARLGDHAPIAQLVRSRSVTARFNGELQPDYRITIRGQPGAKEQYLTDHMRWRVTTSVARGWYAECAIAGERHATSEGAAAQLQVPTAGPPH